MKSSEIVKKFSEELTDIDGEFWKNNTGDCLLKVFNEMVSKGFSEDDAFKLIGDIYRAASSEYGD